VNAVRIGVALQEALISGKMIEFDEQGNRIDWTAKDQVKARL